MEVKTTFLGDLLELLYILSVILVLLYSLFIFVKDTRVFYHQMLLPRSDPNKISFLIDPSPQKNIIVPFETIQAVPEVEFSVVVPISNGENWISRLLAEICEFLDQIGAISSEILIVDNFSSDKSYQIALDFAEREKRVRILRLNKTHPPGFCAVTGAIHSRGQKIMVHFPYIGIGVPELKKFNERFAAFSGSEEKSILFGIFSEKDVPNTNFYNCLSCFSSLLWSLIGIEGGPYQRSHSIMMSRSAAKILLPKVLSTGISYEIELIALSGQNNVEVDSVFCEQSSNNHHQWSSMDRLSDLILQIMLVIMIKTGVHRFIVSNL